MERQEYTAETYPSFGKKYNGEKAIISLTSWKARINTVSKTLYSLLKQCPGFHIVLVLSEEEFPKMMKELPENLKLFVENELIEVLWVYRNYKAFKKVLFTMNKYKNVPVISADDDCIYVKNYAEELYNTWLTNKTHIISICHIKPAKIQYHYGAGGRGILFPPNCFKNIGINIVTIFWKFISRNNQDDGFFGVLAHKLHINWQFLHKMNDRTNPFVNLTGAEKVGMSNNKMYNLNDVDIFEKVIGKYNESDLQ